EARKPGSETSHGFLASEFLFGSYRICSLDESDSEFCSLAGERPTPLSHPSPVCARFQLYRRRFSERGARCAHLVAFSFWRLARAEGRFADGAAGGGMSQATK